MRPSPCFGGLGTCHHMRAPVPRHAVQGTTDLPRGLLIPGAHHRPVTFAPQRGASGREQGEARGSLAQADEVPRSCWRWASLKRLARAAWCIRIAPQRLGRWPIRPPPTPGAGARHRARPHRDAMGALPMGSTRRRRPVGPGKAPARWALLAPREELVRSRRSMTRWLAWCPAELQPLPSGGLRGMPPALERADTDAEIRSPRPLAPSAIGHEHRLATVA